MCEAAREDALPAVVLVNPSLAPLSPCPCRASPSSGSQTICAFTSKKGLRLSGAYLEPGQINMGVHKAQDPTPIPLPWREPGVFFSWHVKAALHKPQRGLQERPGQARAWGCQGREKGLGQNENKLPDCYDFIPYLLLSTIQNLPCFYPAEAARVFLQRLFE